jgi:hypothetical protein
MDAKSLNEMFPDEYNPQAIDLMTNNLRLATHSNCAELAAKANTLFSFFISYPKKSGLYFVDWGARYSDLDKFLKMVDIYRWGANERSQMFQFQRNYDISEGLLYERLGIIRDDRDEGPLIL